VCVCVRERERETPGGCFIYQVPDDGVPDVLEGVHRDETPLGGVRGFRWVGYPSVA